MLESWVDNGELADETDETAEMSLDEMRAAAVMEATGVFIEAQQQISEAKGRDDPDDLERAVNAVKHVQRIAFNALHLYGFTPRGTLVE
jgi:hypothetical protein